MWLFLLALTAQPDFTLGIETEIGGISDDARVGGNEFTVGDFHLSLGATGTWGPVTGALDWSPEESVVNLDDDPDNNSWMRADGYSSRPSLLGSLRIDLFSAVSLEAGALQFSGLRRWKWSPSLHYRLMPPTVLHSQHFDKGARLLLELGPLRADGGITDGDWRFGETSVTSIEGSVANTTPAIDSNVAVDLGPFSLGASTHIGDVGSFPGEKRRADNLTAWAILDVSPFKVRAHAVYLERNPEGDGSGRRVRRIYTHGFGLEVATPFELWRARVIPSAHAWWMRRHGGGPDGQVWTGSADEAWGWMVGVKVEDPATRIYVSVAYQETTIPGFERVPDESQLMLFALGFRW